MPRNENKTRSTQVPLRHGLPLVETITSCGQDILKCALQFCATFSPRDRNLMHFRDPLGQGQHYWYITKTINTAGTCHLKAAGRASWLAFYIHICMEYVELIKCTYGLWWKWPCRLIFQNQEHYSVSVWWQHIEWMGNCFRFWYKR
jgi:hypothetical protein